MAVGFPSSRGASQPSSPDLPAHAPTAEATSSKAPATPDVDQGADARPGAPDLATRSKPIPTLKRLAHRPNVQIDTPVAGRSTATDEMRGTSMPAAATGRRGSAAGLIHVWSRKPPSPEELDQKAIREEAWCLLFHDRVHTEENMKSGEDRKESQVGKWYKTKLDKARMRTAVDELIDEGVKKNRDLFLHETIIEMESDLLADDLLASYPDIFPTDADPTQRKKHAAELVQKHLESRFQGKTEKELAIAIIRQYEQKIYDYQSYKKGKLEEAGLKGIDLERALKDEMAPFEKQRKKNRPVLHLGRELGLALWTHQWRDDLIEQKLKEIHDRKTEQDNALFKPDKDSLRARQESLDDRDIELREMIKSGEHAPEREEEFKSELGTIANELQNIRAQLTEVDHRQTEKQREIEAEFELHRSTYREQALRAADEDIAALSAGRMSTRDWATFTADKTIDEARQVFFNYRLNVLWRDKSESPYPGPEKALASATARERETLNDETDAAFSPTRSKVYSGMSKAAIAMAFKSNMHASKAYLEGAGREATKEQEESDRLESELSSVRLQIKRRRAKVDEWDSDGSEEMELKTRVKTLAASREEHYILATGQAPARNPAW